MADDRVAQAEIIIYKWVDETPLFLLLKRIASRGGFWQPITGGIHPGEDYTLAAKREVEEETGVSDFLEFHEGVHYFEFLSIGYGHRKEYVYGAQFSPDAKITLSSEHDEMKWCTLEESLELLAHESNREGFRKLSTLIHKAK